MNLDIIVLSEVRKRRIPYDITSIWSLKYDTSEHMYKTQTDLQRADMSLPERRRSQGEMEGGSGLAH